MSGHWPRSFPEKESFVAVAGPELRWGVSCRSDRACSQARELVRQSHHAVAEAVEGFAASGGDVGIELLMGFGDGVEEAPDVAFSELPVRWFAPLTENLRNLGGGDSAAVEGADDEVVRFVVGDALLLVGVDALIEFDEAVSEFADGPAGEVAEVSLGKAGVLAAEFNLAGEGEVVTHEDLSPGDHGSREGFVVTVSQADDPAVVGMLMTGELEFEEAEVAGAIMTEGVGLATELEAPVGELLFDLGEEVLVRHGIPSLGVGGSGDFVEVFAGDLLGSAMEQEARWPFLDDFWIFDEVVHDFGFVF